jgi:hypothetical protein
MGVRRWSTTRRSYEKARFRRTGETIEDGKAWVDMEITADAR